MTLDHFCTNSLRLLSNLIQHQKTQKITPLSLQFQCFSVTCFNSFSPAIQKIIIKNTKKEAKTEQRLNRYLKTASTLPTMARNYSFIILKTRKIVSVMRRNMTKVNNIYFYTAKFTTLILFFSIFIRQKNMFYYCLQ